MPGKERAKYLFRIARLIQERARELAVVETLDNGKPIRESRDVDIPLAAAHFFYYAGWADKLDHAGYGPNPQPLGVAGRVVAQRVGRPDQHRAVGAPFHLGCVGAEPDRPLRRERRHAPCARGPVQASVLASVRNHIGLQAGAGHNMLERSAGMTVIQMRPNGHATTAAVSRPTRVLVLMEGGDDPNGLRGSLGGVARRAALIERYRKLGPVIVVDGGGWAAGGIYDEASDGADAFRYLAVAIQGPNKRKSKIGQTKLAPPENKLTASAPGLGWMR